MLKKSFTLFLILSHINAFVLSSMGNVYAANQVVDTTKSPTTFIDTTANGVDLINISNPNSVGVSVNHYNKFNVGNQGAILNNSKVMGTSQLGGVVYGNPNLNQNADIILNEVGTTNRSVLNGALEVFGKNAAVVIANPNGFDCNGCSFINTSKLTMVSGRSQMSDGAITGFKINNDLTSNFVIGELGLYVNNTNDVNIISRAIELRGELQAKQDLALKQGNDYYNYITGEVTSDNSPAPIEFGIDASHLTNISAGRIKLIVTEKGAGVNTTDGNIITDLSKLEITADGDLVLKANLSSQTDINLTSVSGDITQSGNIKALQNIDINANQAYQNDSGSIVTQANLDIAANTINSNGGQFTIDKNTNIKTESDITLNSNVQSLGGIDLTSNQGQITQTGDLTSNSDIKLQASNNVNQSGSINSQQNIILVSNTGSIKQLGDLIANLAVDLSADNHIEQLGNINSQQNINLTSNQGKITQTGDLLANSDINLQANNNIIQSGNINTQQNITLVSNTGSINNSGDLTANLAVNLSADSNVEQLGNINAQQTINLTSNKGAITQVGNLFANSDINLQASNDINQSGNVNSQQNITLISNAGSINHSGNLVANSDINLSSNSNITQSGDIKAAQNININAQGIYQNQGKDTIAQNNLNITVNTVNNKGGQLAAGVDVNITADTLNNTQNTEQTQGGLIYAGNKLDLAISNQLTNDQSSIIAKSDIAINGTNLVVNNKSGVIQSDANISITAKDLNNTAYHYDTKVNDGDGYYGYDIQRVNKSGYVMDQTLVLEQDEHNSTLASKPSFITALKNVAINLSNELFNASSVISAKQDLIITANKVTNQTDSVATHEMYRKWGKMWQERYCTGHDISGDCDGYAYRTKTDSWTDTRDVLLAYSSNKGTLSAGNNLNISANESITNGSVIQNNEFLTAQASAVDIIDNTQVSGATSYQGNDILNDSLVRSGQFTINKPNANRPYIIETRNEFTDITQFKASQYLFARPNIRFLDPSMPNPIALGDAYWEHQKLQRQIIERTKKAELYAGFDMNATFERLFNQSNEEFEKLTNQGIEITFGVSLSKAAIKALTQDIIWYENEEVEINGEKYTALVPRLYLANATLDDLTKSPQAFLSAQNITINSDGQVENSGQIASEGDTNITANNITNQNGVIKGNNINLSAQNTILNQSGDIKAANDLTLKANTLANIASEQVITQKRDTLKAVGTSSNLAGKNININAGDVINTASNINANNLDITANNVSVTTQQNTTNLKAGSGDNYSNSQSTKHQASNITVSGDLNITADNINIQGSKVSANNANIKSDNLTISAVQDSKSTQMKSSSSGGFFGGSSESTVNSQKTTSQGSELEIANKLTIQNQQTQIIASKVKAKTIQITTDLLSLISAKDLDYLKETSDSSGFLTRTITDKGHQQETIKETIIQAQSISVNGQALTIAGQSVENALSTQSLNNQLLQTLSSQSQLTQQLKDAGIDLQSLTANNQDWDESVTTLSGMGALIVKAIVTYFTAGIGTALVEAGSAAMQVAIDAAMQSLIDQVATSFVSGMITGDMNFDMEAIIKGAVVAGATTYASDYIASKDGLNIAKDTTQYDIANTVTSAGINTAINGGSLSDNLKNSAIDTIGKNLAKDIGKSYGIDSFNQGIESMDYWTHKALHAGLGCATSSAKGGDCSSGAAGAAIGEMIAESYTKSQGERLVTNSDDVQNEAKLIGRLGAIFTAQAADLDVNDAYDTSSNAIENNNKVIITLGKVSAKLGKKLLQKGKLTKQDLKDAGLDEYVDIVDDLNTIATSGDPVATGLAIADLIIGTNFNSKKTKAVNNSKKIKVKKPKSIGQLNKQVERGQAPRGIKRVDKGGNTGTGKTTGKTVEQDHVTFDNGVGLNKDGTWKDPNRGKVKITNKQKEWLLDNDWKLPND